MNNETQTDPKPLTSLPCERALVDRVRALASEGGVVLQRFVEALERGWALLTPEQKIKALGFDKAKKGSP